MTQQDLKSFQNPEAHLKMTLDSEAHLGESTGFEKFSNSRGPFEKFPDPEAHHNDSKRFEKFLSKCTLIMKLCL